MNVGRGTAARRAAAGRAIGAGMVVALLIAQPAAAWDKRGHNIIADLAYQRLDAGARAQVDQLLTYAARQGTPGCPVSSLHEAANWADCIRSQAKDMEKQMHLHHTDRVPVCGPVDANSFCTGGRCAAGDIERELPILSDRRADPVDRLHALEAVIHLVGDEHQPIHAVASNASQGNPVNYPGEKKPRNLHAMWDIDMVNAAVPKGSEPQLAADANRNAATWSRGSFRDWAVEANAVARKYAYAPLPQPQTCGVTPPGVTQNLSQGYIDQAAPAVRIQLERAGVRLANVLNRALG